jgi:naphthalene 1,2-dioxygenase system ferredoxin subunit
MAAWLTVGTVADVSVGQLLGVAAGDVRVLVADVAGEYLAVGDVCPHASCLLSEGWLEGDAVVCGCHRLDSRRLVRDRRRQEEQPECVLSGWLEVDRPRDGRARRARRPTWRRAWARWPRCAGGRRA